MKFAGPRPPQPRNYLARRNKKLPTPALGGWDAKAGGGCPPAGTMISHARLTQSQQPPRCAALRSLALAIAFSHRAAPSLLRPSPSGTTTTRGLHPTCVGVAPTRAVPPCDRACAALRGTCCLPLGRAPWIGPSQSTSSLHPAGGEQKPPTCEAERLTIRSGYVSVGPNGSRFSCCVAHRLRFG
jgi:hypothetical protein